MDFGERQVLTPQERRDRNREEVAAAILDAAREIMREEGAGALNLNKLAKRVSMTTPALYSYFSSKFAIYDALYQQGLRLMREYDAAIWQEHPPGWDRIRAWMEARFTFALDHPDLYHLMFSNPVPGFLPSEASVAESQAQLANARRGLSEVIEADVISPEIPTERAVDLLLAIRHGILAERIGKANVVPADSGRFDHLIDDAISMLQQAWSSAHEVSTGGGGAPG